MSHAGLGLREEPLYKGTLGAWDLGHERSPLHLRRLKSQHHEKSSSTSTKSPPLLWPRPRGGPPPASFFPSDVLALSKLVTRGRLGASAHDLSSSPPRCCFASLSLNTRSATLLSTFTVGVTVSGLLYEVLLRSDCLHPAGESFG